MNEASRTIEIIPLPVKRAHNAIDISGQKYSRLTVIRCVGKDRNRRTHWECRCDCGAIMVTTLGALRSGNTQSCGCLQIQHGHASVNGKHGVSSSEYSTWESMKSRCLNPNNVGYKNYGGRGITICERWLHSFENFLADMGKKPTLQHTIERNNNNGNYEPGNCRWATRKEQQANTRRKNRNPSG